MVSAESQAAMDNAAKAVREFMTKNGQKDTIVYELVRPAVYHETITRNEREEVITVLDQERHQTHLHISVQPITDEETREPQHSDRILPVEKRVFEHDDRDEVRMRLEAEHAKFFDHTEVVLGERTREVLPTATGEHMHHHVREYIQPIVNKHIIEPHVIHELILKHEVHHLATMHHRASVLPEVTMAEFKRQGGILTGREERFDFFEGEPRSIGGALGNTEQQTTSGVAGDRKTASSGTQNGVAQQPHNAPSSQQGEVGIPQVTQTVADQANSSSAIPSFQAPERRNSLNRQPERRNSLGQQQTAQPNPDSTQAATQVNRFLSNQMTDTSPGAGPAHPGAGGRWSLVPHIPTRGQTLHPGQARASLARPNSPNPETRARPADK